MSAFDTEDLKTEINTIQNKCGESMEQVSPSSTQCTQQKITLKQLNNSIEDTETKREIHNKFLNQTLQSDFISRPHTLDDLVQKEVLVEHNGLKCTYTLNGLDEDHELWVMDIPGTVDPLQLKGQLLQLGDKSKFKIGDDRYCAINRDSKSSLTCVFNVDDKLKRFKAVNVKPAGTISIRRKISGISKKKLQFERSEGVPYPKNIKVRHPFFGVQIDDSIIKVEKKS